MQKLHFAPCLAKDVRFCCPSRFTDSRLFPFPVSFREMDSFVSFHVPLLARPVGRISTKSLLQSLARSSSVAFLCIRPLPTNIYKLVGKSVIVVHIPSCEEDCNAGCMVPVPALARSSYRQTRSAPLESSEYSFRVRFLLAVSAYYQ